MSSVPVTWSLSDTGLATLQRGEGLLQVGLIPPPFTSLPLLLPPTTYPPAQEHPGISQVVHPLGEPGSLTLSATIAREGGLLGQATSTAALQVGGASHLSLVFLHYSWN